MDQFWNNKRHFLCHYKIIMIYAYLYLMKFDYLCTSNGKQQRISVSPMTSPKVKPILRFCWIICTLIYKLCISLVDVENVYTSVWVILLGNYFRDALSNTCASLANRYKASVRLLFESFSARIEKPATEPAKTLLHHPLKQSHK